MHSELPLSYSSTQQAIDVDFDGYIGDRLRKEVGQKGGIDPMSSTSPVKQGTSANSPKLEDGSANADDASKVDDDALSKSMPNENVGIAMDTDTEKIEKPPEVRSNELQLNANLSKSDDATCSSSIDDRDAVSSSPSVSLTTKSDGRLGDSKDDDIQEDASTPKPPAGSATQNTESKSIGSNIKDDEPSKPSAPIIGEEDHSVDCDIRDDEQSKPSAIVAPVDNNDRECTTKDNESAKQSPSLIKSEEKVDDGCTNDEQVPKLSTTAQVSEDQSGERNTKDNQLPKPLTSLAKSEDKPGDGEIKDDISSKPSGSVAGKSEDHQVESGSKDERLPELTASLTTAKESQSNEDKSSAANAVDLPTSATNLPTEDQEWTAEQHRAFVLSIFEVGLKNCSPSVIMETMNSNPQFITRERTKSHLQKFRKTREKSKQEFLKEYDAFLKSAEAASQKETKEGKKLSPDEVVSTVLGQRNSNDLLGGEAAGLLSYSVINKCNENPEDKPLTYKAVKSSFPILTAKEKASPLGVSLTRIKGLLMFMTDNLLTERLGLRKKKVPEQPKPAPATMNIKRIKSSSSASTDDDQTKPSASRTRKLPPPAPKEHSVARGPTIPYPHAPHGAPRSYPFPPHPPQYPPGPAGGSYRPLPHVPPAYPNYMPYHQAQHGQAPSPSTQNNRYAYPPNPPQYPRPPFSPPYAHHPHPEWRQPQPPHQPSQMPNMPYHAPSSPHVHPNLAAASSPMNAAPHGSSSHQPQPYEGYTSTNRGQHYWSGDHRQHSGGNSGAWNQSPSNRSHYSSGHHHDAMSPQDHSRQSSRRDQNDDNRFESSSSPRGGGYSQSSGRNRSRGPPEREIDSRGKPRRDSQENEQGGSSRRERRDKRTREPPTYHDERKQWASSPYHQDTEIEYDWESPEKRRRRERSSPRTHSSSPKGRRDSSPRHRSQRRKFHHDHDHQSNQSVDTSHGSDLFRDSPPLERVSPREDSGSRSYLSFTVGDIRVLTPVNLPSYDGDDQPEQEEEEEEEEESWIPAKFHPTDVDPMTQPHARQSRKRSRDDHSTRGDREFDADNNERRRHRHYQHQQYHHESRSPRKRSPTSSSSRRRKRDRDDRDIHRDFHP